MRVLSLLFLAFFLCRVPLTAAVVHTYTPPQQWGYDEFSYRIGTITGSGLPAGNQAYNVTLERTRPDGVKADVTFRVDFNGDTPTTAVPYNMLTGNNQTNNGWQVGTYTWRFKQAVSFGGTVITEGKFFGSLTVDVVNQPNRGPGNVATIAQGTYVFTEARLHLGFYDDCPPRDLTFKLDLAIQAAQHESHAVELKLLINEVEAAALPRTVSKGPVSMNLSLAIPNVAGAFTYKWTLNGKTVASGMWGCGDEIPFNIVSDLATETAEPLPDQDQDGDPDESDFDDDGDGIPDVNEGIEPPKTPPPGTNAGPGAPIGSEGTPIPPKGSTAPQPGGSGGGGGSGESSDVNVLNVKDFGEQFKWAMENAGNNNGFFPSPGNGQAPYPGVGWSDPQPGDLSTSPIDDAKEALDDAEEAAELLKGDVSDQVAALASHRPTVMGIAPGTTGVWRMDIGQIGTDLFGRSYWDVDMRPFASAVSAFRSFVTWILLVIAWFKFWNFFRSLVPA